MHDEQDEGEGLKTLKEHNRAQQSRSSLWKQDFEHCRPKEPFPAVVPFKVCSAGKYVCIPLSDMQDVLLHWLW